MSGKQNPKIKPPFDLQTRLDQIGLTHIDVVLTERFLLPPAALRKIGESVPETIAEIAALSGMDPSEVMSTLQECLDLSRDLEIEIDSLSTEAAAEGTVVLDMRPDIEIDSEPLHESARLFHAQNPQQLLPFLRTQSRIFVLSHSAEHAWSAALSLRKHGIKAWLPKIAKNTH